MPSYYLAFLPYHRGPSPDYSISISAKFIGFDSINDIFEYLQPGTALDAINTLMNTNLGPDYEISDGRDMESQMIADGYFTIFPNTEVLYLVLKSYIGIIDKRIQYVFDLVENEYGEMEIECAETVADE